MKQVSFEIVWHILGWLISGAVVLGALVLLLLWLIDRDKSPH